MQKRQEGNITLEADTILGLLAEDVKAGEVSLGPRRKIWPKGPKHESAIFGFLQQDSSFNRCSVLEEVEQETSVKYVAYKLSKEISIEGMPS
jgi:hypothetical protein